MHTSELYSANGNTNSIFSVFCVHVANAAASVPSRQERLSGKRINVRKVSKI